MDKSGAAEGGNGGESATPSFDEVVRKMLNTPPKPKKADAGRAARKDED